MKFSNHCAVTKYNLSVNESESDALKKVTHLGIGAHQDDIEILASHGIVSCIDDDNNFFAGIVCTDGAGSARTGKYADFSDKEMMEVRKVEQEKAAELGHFKFLAQLSHPSSVIKDVESTFLTDDIECAIKTMGPSVVYTHNLADKHDTHIAVVVSVINAIRRLPKDIRPKKLYGCEVWRGLDWMLDSDKLSLDVSEYSEFIQRLISIYDSQIAGGKRYDLATLGRMRANATYSDSHSTDQSSHLWYAMDLTPLIENDDISISDYMKGYLNRFTEDILGKISKFNQT